MSKLITFDTKFKNPLPVHLYIYPRAFRYLPPCISLFTPVHLVSKGGQKEPIFRVVTPFIEHAQNVLYNIYLVDIIWAAAF